MQETFTINSAIRTVTGKQVKKVRQAGKIPGVVYGHGFEARSIEFDGREFIKVFGKAGESTLIDLVIGTDKPFKVLVQDVDRHPLRDDITHVDFHQVNMTETLETEIPLVYIGESAAVKGLGGIMLHSMSEIKVRCLPGDLVHEITLDLSVLKNIGDSIKIADLPKIPGIEFLSKPEEIIMVVNEPISEAELAELEAAPVAADVSKVKVKGEEEKKAAEAAKAEEEKDKDKK